MSMFTKPAILFESADGGSSPIEASIQSGGEKIRILSDPYSGHLNGAWLNPREAREFALEILGLCDAAEIISGCPEENPPPVPDRPFQLRPLIGPPELDTLTRRYLEAVEIANGR
jgi:hypothetical protein